jgi:nitrate reductase delta subunit
MIAATDRAVAQQACALLLGYPDEALLDRLELVAAAVEQLPGATRAPLQAFLVHVRDADADQLRAHYVATFDMRRRCCPYLTYWTHGDTRNRGLALLHFKQTYRDSGAAPPEEELPDHLAVVLEFAATTDPTAGNELLAEHRAPIELLRAALREATSPYAHVLDAVVATLPAPSPETLRRAQELAAAGPPAELVGAGYSAHPNLRTESRFDEHH